MRCAGPGNHVHPAGRRFPREPDRPVDLPDHAHVMQVLDDHDDAHDEHEDHRDRQELPGDFPERNAGDGDGYEEREHCRFLTGPRRRGHRGTVGGIAFPTGAVYDVGVTGPLFEISVSVLSTVDAPTSAVLL